MMGTTPPMLECRFVCIYWTQYTTSE